MIGGGRYEPYQSWMSRTKPINRIPSNNFSSGPTKSSVSTEFGIIQACRRACTTREHAHFKCYRACALEPHSPTLLYSKGASSAVDFKCAPKFESPSLSSPSEVRRTVASFGAQITTFGDSTLTRQLPFLSTPWRRFRRKYAPARRLEWAVLTRSVPCRHSSAPRPRFSSPSPPCAFRS